MQERHSSLDALDWCNWPTFERFPPEDRIVRFDDVGAAEAELVYVRGHAANAWLREV